MSESTQVEQAARRAIARAKARGDADVTPDDLLVGALAQISRFGIAWIGEWPVDVKALENGARQDAREGEAGEDEDEDTAPPATAYTPATVQLFEQAAALARHEGSSTTGLVHLLAAFADGECGLMAELRERHGFSEAEWRATLARGPVGAPPRLAGSAGGASDRRGSSPSPQGPEILGVDEAAEYLGVHAQTVRNYIRNGKLPAYRLAGERFIRLLRRDLLALLERVPTDASEDDEET